MPYVFASTNPCLCRSTPSTPDPECSDECNCLKVCTLALNANDSRAVGPCAKTGTIDMMGSEFDHDFCACGENTPRWSVEYFDPAVFVTVLITKAGVLTWITRGPDKAGEYGQIVLKTCCGALSYYSEHVIGVKDLCDCPECNDCDTCDACTGECEDVEIDIFLNTVSQTGNTTLE